MKAQGFNTGFSEDARSLNTMVQPNIVNNVNSHIIVNKLVQPKRELNNSALNGRVYQQEIPATVETTLNLDDIMDDSSSGLGADPMLSSHPVSPNMEDDSMDYEL